MGSQPIEKRFAKQSMVVFAVVGLVGFAVAFLQTAVLHHDTGLITGMAATMTCIGFIGFVIVGCFSERIRSAEKRTTATSRRDILHPRSRDSTFRRFSVMALRYGVLPRLSCGRNLSTRCIH